MQRYTARKVSGQTCTWTGAVIFSLVQLLTVLAVYSLHQRALDTQFKARAEAWGPAELSENEHLLDLPKDFNKQPPVRLHEADIELLRTEIASIISDLPAARVLRDATEDSVTAKAFLLGSHRAPELPPSDPQVPRLADESHHPDPDSNILGVQDLHAEFREYTERLLTTWTEDFSTALSRQHRPSAKDLGLHAEDSMADLGSLNTRITFLNDLYAETKRNKAPVGVAIATTTSVDLWGVRKELLPWLQYHTDLGVTKFYILYDGNDPDAVESLRAIHHVELMHIHRPWASELELALWEAQNNLTGAMQWKSTQGNYELMDKQGFCLHEALKRAQILSDSDHPDKISWLMHLDPDELFLPGGFEGSLAAELARQPAHVPAVRFMNFEGQPEVGDASNRFEQVTLFRAHKHFITPEAFWYRNRFKLGENAAFLYLYANGKSAVRVDAPGVQPSGPHYFSGSPSARWSSSGNPRGNWKNYVSDTSVVLHYAYSHPSEVAAKAHRSCPGGNYTEAGKAGNRELIKKACFVIDFDADAFMAAVQGEKAVEDFYYSRMVLSEGSPVRCSKQAGGGGEQQGWCSLSDIPRFTHLMEKIGLFRRLLLPQMLLRQHERTIQRKLKGPPEGK